MHTLWDRVRSQYYSVGDNELTQFKRNVLGKKLTDFDLPVLQVEIDQARFPIVDQDYQFALTRNRVFEGSDFDAKAEALIEKLQWHVAEG